MMGQQQQTVTKAGGALRRAVVLMTVVALMAVMLAMSVAPAFAGPNTGKCMRDTDITIYKQGGEKAQFCRTH